MELTLPDSERVLLQQAQRACRGQAGYVPVTVLLMLDQGHAAARVAQALGVDVSSVYRYAQTYQLHGLAGYLRAEQPGYWGLLTSAQLAGLCRELDQQLYTDCRAIADWLAATYGVRYSVSGLTDVLHRLGFSYKLTTAVPCQADAAAQTAFLTDTLVPLLEAAAAGDAVVYFADAAHPTHNTRATHVWTETGKERPLLTVSGRERVNLNAALNAHCPTQVHLDETDCVNAQSTQRLYEKLLAAHPQGPVHVICDNARYYKNKALNAWLTDKRLLQVFLPPYSPNLNLIERLWKFLRQKIINTSFYRTKGQFKTAVLDFFDRLDEFGPELASRMRLKFHVLDSQSNS
ncbi:IS630 family transposase [Hymenobacter siberiensis]|uniref:IS630 family transposase n=1 Tax=Hymenobacter siberiensis TaxID=2848396 RepID=UPI001C1E70D6|nr:IS630 family transposase [Hymenobacter siberiensis]MBU6119271.1 IS630 family transposase [Hymenobacter siberiensis]